MATLTPSELRLVGTPMPEPDHFGGFLTVETPRGRLRIERREDPILMTGGLAKFSDEREYADRMGTDPVIRESSKRLCNLILDHEIHFQPQRENSSPAAALLAEFVAEQWSALRNPAEVIRQILEGALWGWRPIRSVPRKQATFRGQVIWRTEVEGFRPHLFAWTKRDEDGRRHLVYLPLNAFTSEHARVIDSDELRLAWIAPKSGGDGPYGRGLLSDAWLAWRLISQAREQTFRGIDLSLGGYELNIQGMATEGAAQWLRSHKQEIDEVFKVFTAKNLLVKPPGWKFEPIEGSAQTIDSGIKLLEHLDKMVRTAITGSTLTATTTGVGSMALGQVHERVNESFARAIVRETLEVALADWARGQVMINIDREPDPRDLPRAVSEIHRKATAESIKQYIDMGGTVTAGATATALGVQEVSADDPEAVLEPTPGLSLPSLPSRTLTRAVTDPQESEAEAQREKLLRLAQLMDPKPIDAQVKEVVRRFVRAGPKAHPRLK